MGICMYAQTLTDDKIDAVMSNPPLVWRIVAPDETQAYLNEIGASKPPGFFARLLGKKQEWPPEIPEFEFSENEKHELDMDKSWDGVNFCLKQIVLPGECKNLFEDGTPVGKIEIGYGPAMCLSSADIAKIARRYNSVSESALLAQYVPSKMKGVYPEGLWAQDNDDCREYLTENFAGLKVFLENAEKHRLGIIVQYT